MVEDWCRTGAIAMREEIIYIIILCVHISYAHSGMF